MDDGTIAIIAGGRSRRMGQNKSFVSVQGKPMIEHILECLASLKATMILITNQPYDYKQFDLPMFGDVIPDQGTLIRRYLYGASSQSNPLCAVCSV